MWNLERVSLEGIDSITDDAFAFNWDVDPRPLAKQSYLSCLTVRVAPIAHWVCKCKSTSIRFVSYMPLMGI